MRFRHALMAIATAVSSFAAGCSQPVGSEFQEYVDDAAKNRSPVAKPAETTKTAAAVAASSGTKSSPPATAGRDVLAKTLPAALGVGSHVILSDSFRIPPEQWLTPAVGPAAAAALLTRLNSAGNSKRSAKSAAAASGTSQAAVPPRKVQVLVKSKEFRVEGPDGAIRVSYDDIDLLKVLNMEPVTPDAPRFMPAWLKELHGKRIRIRGFMSPAFKQTGLEGFLMGRDNKACCFPGRAKIYDLFPVRLRQGHTTDYIQNRPFDVVGTFQIKPWIEDGELLRLYQIVDAVVAQ